MSEKFEYLIIKRQLVSKEQQKSVKQFDKESAIELDLNIFEELTLEDIFSYYIKKKKIDIKFLEKFVSDKNNQNSKTNINNDNLKNGINKSKKNHIINDEYKMTEKSDVEEQNNKNSEIQETLKRKRSDSNDRKKSTEIKQKLKNKKNDIYSGENKEISKIKKEKRKSEEIENLYEKNNFISKDKQKENNTNKKVASKDIDIITDKPDIKKVDESEQKITSGAVKTGNGRFSRINMDLVNKNQTQINNAYNQDGGDYGSKVKNRFDTVRGKDFKKEKGKMKNHSSTKSGGKSIDLGSNSFKFTQSDEE